MGRKVDVEDVGRGAVEDGLDAIYFKDVVREEGGVYWGVGDGVVDKEGYATTLPTAGAVLPDDGIAWEVGRFEF